VDTASARARSRLIDCSSSASEISAGEVMTGEAECYNAGAATVGDETVFSAAYMSVILGSGRIRNSTNGRSRGNPHCLDLEP
jgi:hypothetical protein